MRRQQRARPRPGCWLLPRDTGAGDRLRGAVGDGIAGLGFAACVPIVAESVELATALREGPANLERAVAETRRTLAARRTHSQWLSSTPGRSMIV